jgi:hypothetical protein
VPRHYWIGAPLLHVNLGQEIERKPFRVLRTGPERETQPDKRVEQPMLRSFDAPPTCPIVPMRDVRNCSIVPASRTVLGRIGRWDQPIAYPVSRIRAIPVSFPWVRERHESVTLGHQRSDNLSRFKVSKSRTTTFTGTILKINGLSAILAFKQFHLHFPIKTTFADGNDDQMAKFHLLVP